MTLSATLRGGKQLNFFGIFDGHNGFHMSQFLAKHLVPFVVHFLEHLYYQSQADFTKPAIDGPSELAVHKAIQDGFLALDKAVVEAPLERVFSSPSKAAAVQALREAMAGSCALLAVHDNDTGDVRIALTGDSRAVLGRRKRNFFGSVTYDVHVLTADHNGNNPAEVTRLNAEHPGEVLFEKSRFVGWGPSRFVLSALYSFDNFILVSFS